MIHVTFEQINDLLKIEDLFEPVKQAFIDYNSSSLIGVPVSLLYFPNNADTHIKTAAIKGYDFFSIKVVVGGSCWVSRELTRLGQVCNVDESLIIEPNFSPLISTNSDYYQKLFKNLITWFKE